MWSRWKNLRTRDGCKPWAGLLWRGSAHSGEYIYPRFSPSTADSELFIHAGLLSGNLMKQCCSSWNCGLNREKTPCFINTSWACLILKIRVKILQVICEDCASCGKEIESEKAILDTYRLLRGVCRRLKYAKIIQPKCEPQHSLKASRSRHGIPGPWSQAAWLQKQAQHSPAAHPSCASASVS